jgi:putative transposase
MARSRYTITEVDKPHFLTCTIVEWLPLFTRPAQVDVVLETWRFQQANQGSGYTDISYWRTTSITSLKPLT